MASDHQTPDHVPGSMDIAEQQRTFYGFVRFWAWFAAAIVLVLIFMALSNA
ncbi:MAG: aa3-type cytochrome c oxidase subunit IV [Paracoccus sp. (in: a-proteobacteria)]|uniref:aa3-type cytochrome c oxidase subunit IV n=1 Tax=Paracoccus sp. TaxID=267 RepID=UPI0026E0DD9A|nr:aa3-type cytochrome c oxidase subunit IV [Paracoccus sp. (in: a-proteobacteria)]MDO5621455.1 aa3-type cytochrome c oxidase subunit IV [Paracoccus sp. (in: a-proteobacteria)]